jgi:hypothetical protein
MNRRELLFLLAGATPRALRAQQKAMPVVGYLSEGAPGPPALAVAAFRQGLTETGYVEGQNVTIPPSPESMKFPVLCSNGQWRLLHNTGNSLYFPC